MTDKGIQGTSLVDMTAEDVTYLVRELVSSIYAASYPTECYGELVVDVGLGKSRLD